MLKAELSSILKGAQKTRMPTGMQRVKVKLMRFQMGMGNSIGN
jgi:hypothetical protein